jgi:hypothetical protein
MARRPLRRIPVRQLGFKDGTLGFPNFNPYLPGTGWVVLFVTQDMSIPLTEYECFHAALDGPIGSSVTVLLNGSEWDFINQGYANAWDPSQPLPLTSGDEIGFAWNFAFTSPPYNRTSNVQPRVTMWLRSDDASQEIM